jgi:3-oxoacyl-[acyl-carrier-protein] synthase II
MARRVVVTGVGTLNACGNNAEASWEAVVAGRGGVRRISRFDPVLLDMPCWIAAELKDFHPEDHFDRRELKKLDLMTQFGLVAAQEAWESAGLPDANGFIPERAGAIMGTGIGGLDSIEQTHTTILEKGPQRVSPYFVPRMMANAIAGNMSIRFNLKGPNFIVASACASSNHAMSMAHRSIRWGESDLCFTGGAEATITSMGMAGFNSMRAMSRRNDDPERASRPFDRQRDGFVMGEGAGVLVFEELEHAKKRGAPIYAEVLGSGMSADAHHITAPAPGGPGPARAITLALEDAGVNPDQVDYINAHGTSTALNDVAETQAIKTALGDHAGKVAISSSKSLVGHLLGGAGGVEGVFTAMTVRDGVMHPTINQEEPDPDCDLDYVPNEAREAPVRVAVSNCLGFGGHNVSVVFGRFDG